MPLTTMSVPRSMTNPSEMDPVGETIWIGQSHVKNSPRPHSNCGLHGASSSSTALPGSALCHG